MAATAIPPHHQHGGQAYLNYNADTNRFHIVYHTSSWTVDTHAPEMIRQGRMRFYRLVTPLPWYSAYQFATVADDATLVFYNVIENDDLQDQLLENQHSVAYADARPSQDPPTDDRRFREERDGIHVAPPPPPPEDPPAGAAQAAGAESQPRQEPERALPALAAALAWEPAERADNDGQSGLEILRNLLATARAERETQAQDRNRGALHEALRALLAIPEHTNQADPWTINENNNRWPNPRIPLMGENGYGVYVPDYNIRPEPIITNIFNDHINFYTPARDGYVGPQPPVKRVADTMIEAAMAKGESCPISMEPITKESVCVAPCYHCFDKESIQQWLARNESCPTCRTPCAL
jgi:hypothetical protein